MGLMGPMGGCGGGAAAGTPPGCTEGVFGVGITVAVTVGITVAITVGITNFVFLDAVFFFFRHKGMRVCVFFDTKGVQFLKLKVES